jgi:hypothetical protein
MIGVVFTGEKRDKIIHELAFAQIMANDNKPKLFVESDLERKFIKEFDATGVFSGGLIQKGYISQFQGYEVTNSINEYKKRNSKPITKKEIAEKFGVDVECLNIVD